MIKTLRISFALRISYKINAVIYALRQIPLIGKHLPESLHRARWLKTGATVIAFGWELLSGLLSKGAYLGLMVLLPVLAMENAALEARAFMQIFVLLALIGGLHNNDLFAADESSYYAISLLGMNAREYLLISYGYQLLKLNVGYLIFGVLLGMAAQVPWWMCLLMGPFTAGAKCLVAGIELRHFRKTGQTEYSKRGQIASNASSVALYVLAYMPPFLGFALPLPVSLGIMLCVCVAGALNIKTLLTFEDYRVMHQQAYWEHKNVLGTSNARVETNRKHISENKGIVSRRRGFGYFNELFVKRHRKILWGSTVKIGLILTAVVIAGGVLLWYDREMAGEVNRNLVSLVRFLPFLMYMTNRGTSYTEALFVNCDHSLLNYSFYKQPGMILKLFSIRLWEIVRVNLLPGAVIALGLPALLLISGGTENLWDYLLLFTSAIGLNVFFSVHYLTLYYLLQPYNAGSELKNGGYRFVTGLTYGVCYFFSQVEVPGMLFGILCIVFCLIYCAVACVLVYFLAPRTFRIRT